MSEDDIFYSIRTKTQSTTNYKSIDLFAEFHGLDTNILLKALKTLELQRKAEVISFNGSEGVKFF